MSALRGQNHRMSTRRTVVAVPGRSMGPYSAQMALPTIAAIRRGAQPVAVHWDDPASVDDLDRPDIPGWVAAQVDGVLEDAAASGSALVIGKSLGSHAAVAVARLGLPAVWVTPLLTHPSVVAALRAATAPFLLAGGTADPLWKGTLARELTPHILELPHADHALFLPGPLERSTANLGALATAVERFLDDVVWPE